MESRFNPRAFWLTYVVASIVVLVAGLALIDIADFPMIVLAVLYPVPFFLCGYVAWKVQFSVFYALVVIALSFGLSWVILPELFKLIR